MNKKAMEISPPSVVVVIVLLLIVLVVLIFIFTSQSGDFVKIINRWKGEITGRECESPLLGRTCGECPEGTTKDVLPPPPEGQWLCNGEPTNECKRCVRI